MLIAVGLYMTYFTNRNDSILKIEKYIWESFANEKKIGLLTGLSGMALFYDKMYAVYKEDVYLEKLESIVEKVNNILEKEPTLSSLCSGLAGFGLLLLSLKNSSIEIDSEYFEDIDVILLEDLRSFSETDNYDFLHGSMGVAMYFIERCKSYKSQNNISKLNKFAEDLIHKMNQNFKEVLVSETALENDDRFCIYFGIAHGVACYLNFLIHLDQNFDELTSDITSVIKTGVAFLESYKRFDENSKQYYPNLLLIKSGTIVGSRLSWCQGDFGISNALYNCGVFFNEDRLIDEAKMLIKASCQMTLEESLVNDVGICHGSGGIALQYYLASKKYNIDFSPEIEKWLDIANTQTLNYKSFLSFEKGEYHEENNLLEGAAGLGMTLLTVENKIDTKWLEFINLF